jgi:hypothetical protein
VNSGHGTTPTHFTAVQRNFYLVKYHEMWLEKYNPDCQLDCEPEAMIIHNSSLKKLVLALALTIETA